MPSKYGAVKGIHRRLGLETGLTGEPRRGVSEANTFWHRSTALSTAIWYSISTILGHLGKSDVGCNCCCHESLRVIKNVDCYHREASSGTQDASLGGHAAAAYGTKIVNGQIRGRGPLVGLKHGDHRKGCSRVN